MSIMGFGSISDGLTSVSDNTVLMRGSILLTGSKELRENWGILATIYWGVEETSTIDPEEGHKAEKAQVEIIKILGEMRLS